MTKLTTETLKEIIGSYPEGSDEIECLMAQKLLAYEQAANEVACWGVTGQRGQIYPLSPQTARMDSFPLYRAPVLPKQPESRNEIMAKGVEAFAKDWKGSARYSQISEMACNFAAKLRNGDADEC